MTCEIEISRAKDAILEQLRRGQYRLTPRDIIKAVQHHNADLKKNTIRLALKSLLNSGRIVYSHHLSVSQLEINFQQSDQISPRLTLCRVNNEENAGIRLTPGAAFGAGDHPTTRLALKAIDACVTQLQEEISLSHAKALDIGTGSGILAISAIYLGIGAATAIDNDPLACLEATQNAALNQFQDQIQITNCELASLPISRFDLIMANLRPPTLEYLCPMIRRFTSDKGYWILSGFRPDGLNPLLKSMDIGADQVVWQENQNNWSAVAIRAGDRCKNTCKKKPC